VGSERSSVILAEPPEAAPAPVKWRPPSQECLPALGSPFLPASASEPELSLDCLGDPPPAHAQPQRRAAFLGVERWLHLPGHCRSKKEQADSSRFDFFPHLRGGCGFAVPGSQAVEGMPEVIRRQLSGKELGAGAAGVRPREEGFSLCLLFHPDFREPGRVCLSALSFSEQGRRWFLSACFVQRVSSGWKSRNTPCLPPAQTVRGQTSCEELGVAACVLCV